MGMEALMLEDFDHVHMRAVASELVSDSVLYTKMHKSPFEQKYYR